VSARIIADADGRVVAWDSEADALLGYTADEMVGALLSDTIVPPKYRQQHNRGLGDFRRSGSAPALGHRLQVTALCKDLREIPVYLTITRLPGEPPQFLGVITLREELSYFEVLGQQPAPRPAAQSTGVRADDLPLRADVDQLRERVATLERAHDDMEAAWGLTTMGPLEKAVLPEFIRWYIRLKERVGTSTKTGLDLLTEVLATRAERIHLSKSTVVIFGAITPFLVALFAAILTIVAAHFSPTIPTPPGKP
jgi:PAS domain S-box-containing protein